MGSLLSLRSAVKVRLQTQQRVSSWRGGGGIEAACEVSTRQLYYKGAAHAFVRVVREEGVRRRARFDWACCLLGRFTNDEVADPSCACLQLAGLYKGVVRCSSPSSAALPRKTRALTYCRHRRSLTSSRRRWYEPFPPAAGHPKAYRAESPLHRSLVSQ